MGKRRAIFRKRRMCEKFQNRNRIESEIVWKIYEYYFRLKKFNSKFAYASSTNDFETGRSFGKEKLKEVEKSFQWEDHVIQFQKGRDDLANRREVVEKENENSVISLLEEKEKEIRNWQAKIKKLSKNLKESEM